MKSSATSSRSVAWACHGCDGGIGVVLRQFVFWRPSADATLASCTSITPCVMPARLAETDPFERVTEMVGSGPFRFVAGEQVAGRRYGRGALFVNLSLRATEG